MGVGKGAWKVCGSCIQVQKVTMTTLSGLHQAPAHWETPWKVNYLPILTKREGRNGDTNVFGNLAKGQQKQEWFDLRGRAVKILKPYLKALGPPSVTSKWRSLAGIVLSLTLPKLHLATFETVPLASPPFWSRDWVVVLATQTINL